VTDTIRGTISSARGYDLPLSCEDVWEQISTVGNYRNWWPWLRGFDAGALASGEEWRCEVQPPLPYIVRFQVEIEKVVEPALVHALISGDVIGDATLALEESEGGCRATLQSALAPGNAALRLASRFAAPVARYGHDWVLDSGARQFIAQVAPPRPGR
jgi:uncharacterized protein YndB with AHSA1/START domain